MKNSLQRRIDAAQDAERHHAWVKFASAYARSVCRNHPDWDQDDLAGCILLDLVKWPTDKLASRASASTSDWFRRRLGRCSPTMEKMETFDTVMSVGDDGDSVSVLDAIPDWVDYDDHMTRQMIFDAVHRLLVGRDATIFKLAWEGLPQVEIGELLGVSESRVCQLLKDRIVPKMQRWWNGSSRYGMESSDGIQLRTA